MEAYDKRSAEALQVAADILGGSPAVTELIQRVYDLGRTDGRIEKGCEALALLGQKDAA